MRQNSVEPTGWRVILPIDLARSNRTRRPFADELPRLLEERGMTLRRVSRGAGVDHAHLSRVLRGDRRRKVSPDLARRVAVALDLPPDFFPEYREGEVVKAVAGDPDLRDRIYDGLKAR